MFNHLSLPGSDAFRLRVGRMQQRPEYHVRSMKRITVADGKPLWIVLVIGRRRGTLTRQKGSA
jgi:hypothetical protein